MVNVKQEQIADDRFASERDELLERWVQQPPANPNRQHLRDAERTAALDQLGDRKHALDVASESTVTEELRADSLTRVDFSTAASDFAQNLLNESVDRYATADPDPPSLPFDDDEFDAAVSIGPYDWKFLDIDVLMDELNRVVTDNGIVAFSVPTPRSPYARADRHRFRYFTPEEMLRHLSPDWRLVDYDLLFQYPYRLHWTIGKLPAEYQEPFVDVARTLSDRLTDWEAWDAASYLVLGVEPIDYRRYLDEALDCLFRPVGRNGFWDDEGKIIRALEYSSEDGRLSWRPDDSIQWRYAPFALLGVMRWRTSALGNDRYDDKIRRELVYFENRTGDPSTLDAMPSYGIGPLVAAFSLAATAYDDSRYESTARQLYEYSRERFDFTHAEDSLLLFGWSHLYERIPNEDLRRDISDALWRVNEQLTPKGLFEFDNSTAHRHQNQMYTLWGLCAAVEVTGTGGYLDSAEQVLDYTIANRMRDDGAFLWDEPSRWRRLKRTVLKQLGGRPPHWDFLYECHQTFFVNAVAGYYAAGGTKNYDQEVREAMSWIYGDNGLGEDLVEFSELGVPMRQMTIDTRMDVAGQMYKGAYEIGSYVMALTELQTRDRW